MEKWVGAADGRVCFERSCVGVRNFSLQKEGMRSPEDESVMYWFWVFWLSLFVTLVFAVFLYG